MLSEAMEKTELTVLQETVLSVFSVSSRDAGEWGFNP
jgi:hypothetical protein